jgi:membrane fusion protein, multidrug efflux system
LTRQFISSFRRWPIAIGLILLALGGYAGWHHFHVKSSAAAAASRAPALVPVTVTQVKRADFPVYLTGLGTVQPYDTVTVRSRVDGQVTEVGFKQGEMVKQDQILVQIDPRPYQAALDQATAKKAQDEASLKDAQLNLARYGALAQLDFASRQQLNTQQATVQGLMAQIEGDQAAVDNAQTQVSYTTIRSPLAGKAGFRLVDPGNIVHATDTTGVVTIVKLQPISVVFTAPEEDVPDINKALAAGAVPVTALSTDGTKVLSQGHLALVNNAVDQASGTIRMKATFENTDNVLWPGLSVSTRLLLDTLKQAIVVPDLAVERGPNGLYAFVVGAGNKVEMRSVTVARDGDGDSVITQGLTPGENVVVSGQYELQPGTLVKPAETNTQTAAQAQ